MIAVENGDVFIGSTNSDEKLVAVETDVAG